ncbi:MAG: AMP-binding protein [Bacteroidota bacterium]
MLETYRNIFSRSGGKGGFIPEIEQQSLQAIKSYQEQQLVKQLDYLYEKSPYYRKLFLDYQIKIEKIKTLEDLRNIPFTTKDDLQLNSQDMICIDKSKIIDYVTTSGTLGEPVTFALTNHDLERLAYCEYISFCCADGTPNDIYQLITTIDRRFMAGLAYFMGIRKMGAGVVRVGSGISELQWDTIQRIQTNTLITVPSFILKMLEYAEENGIDFQNSSIKKAICIGESLRHPDFSLNTLGERIREKWNIELYSTYASTEMEGGFTECAQGIGGHHHPELLIAEFLDDNGMPVAEGEMGELVITTLGVEGMPLLRFKTGDICNYYSAPCKCGRTSMRLGPIIGRKKQMIKFKGTTLYPPALFDILNNIKEVSNYLVEVYTNELGTDEILLHIGCELPSDLLEKKIKDHFRAKLRVAPVIKFESIEEVLKIQFTEMNRKAITFIDNRINKDE